MTVATSKSVYECTTKEEIDAIIHEQIEILDKCGYTRLFFHYYNKTKMDLYVEDGEYYCNIDDKYIPLCRNVKRQ